MKKQLRFLPITAIVTMSAFVTAHAQANVKTYGLTDAMNLGFTVTAGKYDPAIIQMPCNVSKVGLTLSDALDANYDGSLVILMSKSSTTRVPVLVLCDNGDFARLNVQAVPTKGTSVYVKIVDDKPQPASAREVSARPASTTVLNTPVVAVASPSANPVATVVPGQTISAPDMVLPAPTTLTMSAVNTDQNTIEVTVQNKTAMTMEFQPKQLTLLVDNQTVSVPSNALATLAPGLSAKVSIPYSGPRGNVSASWNAFAPTIRTYFTVKQ